MTGLGALIFLGIAALPDAALPAAAAVQAWKQDWTGTRTPFPTLIAARELADGSNIALAGADVTGLVAVRYDHDGNLLSTAAFSPPFLALYTFPSPNASQASVAAIDPFGGIFVASVSHFGTFLSSFGDIWLMKYDGLTGKPLWPAPRIFDGPPNQHDIPLRVLIDPQGNPVVLGQSRLGNAYSTVVLKYNGVSGADLWPPTVIAAPAHTAILDAGGIYVGAGGGVYKLDPQTGAIVWGPVQRGFGTMHPDALAVGPNGDVVAVGAYGGVIDVIKCSGATGAVLWGPASFAGSSNPPLLATGVDLSPSGDVVVTGVSGTQSVVLKYSGADGSLLWGPLTASGDRFLASFAGNGDVVVSGGGTAWRYGGTNGSLIWGPRIDAQSYGVSKTWIGSNGRIATATVHSDGTAGRIAALERSAETGEEVWSSEMNPPGNGRSFQADLTQGSDGSVFVTGNANFNNFATFKYARSDGAVLWGPVFYENPTGDFSMPTRIRTDSAGDVFVLGNASGPVVLKYRGTTGELIWGPVALLSRASPWSLAVDSAGDVAVLLQAASGSPYQPNEDLAIVKLSGSTGAVLWGPVIFEGQSEGRDSPVEIAVTPANDFVVVAESRSKDNYTVRWVTLKYSGASGTLLWGPSVLDQGSGGGKPQDLAVDPAGDIVVVGYFLSGPDTRMATIKYNGVTGAVIWGPATLGGGAYSVAVASAVALDANADVFVTGGFRESAGFSDFATLKYRGTDGTLLWGPRLFNGSENDSDSAVGVGLDSAGNPVVAGTTRNADHIDDVAILKYDGATGAPLWTVIAGGPGDDDLPLHNLVVRGNSAVIAATSSRRFLTIAFDDAFGIQTLSEEISPAYCGRAFSKTLVAANAAGPLTWSVVSGSLPPGLSLDASTGLLSGTPGAVGSFPFRVRVQGLLGPAERDFVMEILEGTAFAPILATANPVCPGQSVTLSVAGAWSSYHWLPGGQTSSTISVSPTEAADYGVLLTDAGGCRVRGYLRLNVGPGVSVRAPSAVCAGGDGYAAAVDDAGPGATYEWAITNGTIVSGEGTRSITFAAGSGGSVQVNVSVSGAGCAVQSAAADIAIESCSAIPEGLLVDRIADDSYSDGNGVLEAGERVIVEPSWKNIGADPLVLSGTASGFTGPAGSAYTLNDASADYGTISSNAANGCAGTGNCYEVEVSVPSPRPATHWDAVFTETLSDADPARGWTLHIGQSFTDVPKTHVFYSYVEKLLHNGVTTGCGPATYCPEDLVSRLQMAIFIARAHAGGDGNVPASGTAQGSPYDCSPGGTSLFSDVEPTNPFCRHVHSIYGAGVTTGCEPGKYCPEPSVSRAQIAMFIARAMAGSDAAVPLTYGPDPATGRSYSCDAGTPNLHFTDVTTSDIFCRHTHYLWAKDVISGFPDNSYQPGSSVTRGAMAKFLSNGFGLKLSGP